MPKIKVGSLAKSLNIEVKDLVKTLKDLGVEVKTAASSVDETTAKTVTDLLKGPVAVSETVSSPLPASLPSPQIIVEEKPVEASPLKSILLDVPEISLKDFADKLGMKASDLIKELLKKNMLVTINQNIDVSIMQKIAPDLGFEIIIETKAAAEKDKFEELLDSTKLQVRPPIVVIMGHVDHGKTKLLDAIRNTNVMASEAGGITQHIGAYQVEINGRKITFLDTPGHEAFTALRARGAKATDIAILVVAADDGVMPQTIEAIDHAKAADIPIIVAINKIDKEGSNPDKVKQQLSDLGLAPEEWGGKTVTVPVSARLGKGIEDLLEMVLLTADLLELKANPDGLARGTIIESKLDKGAGPIATVLVDAGTLKIGDPIVIGATFGKIRAIVNDKGKKITKAPPATPAEIFGINAVPSPGETFFVVASEKEARVLAEKNKMLADKQVKGRLFTLEDFSKQMKAGERKDLNLIIKSDVQGSLEALVAALKNLSNDKVNIHILHAAVGPVTEADVLLAKSSQSIVIAFHVGYEAAAKTVANQEGVDTRAYNIIYKVTEDIQSAMDGLLEPEFEEVVIGHATVKAIFEFSKLGAIAGCYVDSGLMKRGAKLRQSRDNNIIYEGPLESLKRFKDDVKEVAQNYECGIAIKGYTNFQVGDKLDCIELQPKNKKG